MSGGDAWRQQVLRGRQSIWDRVEAVPPGVQPTSYWTFPAELGEFTYVQSFHADVPDDLDTFEVFDRIGRNLDESVGQAYEGVLRTASGVRVSPPWLHVEDGVVDPASGRIVLAARINHQSCGLSPAYEAGIGGRNIGRFAEAGQPPGLYFPSQQVYLGSLKTGVVGPLDFGRDVHAVDYHHGRQLIGVLSHLGAATGAVSVIDGSGQWRTLTTLDGLTGGYTPFGFSSDGSWLLVSRHDHATLVEVATGRHVVVPTASAYWGPASPSRLVSLRNSPDGSYLETFDLTWNRVVGRQTGPIVMDQPVEPGFVVGINPMPSPDGSRVLVNTHAGVRREYQQRHGCGTRIGLINTDTGRGTVLGDIVLSERLGIERRCSAARWIEKGPQRGYVELGPDLSAQLQPPVQQHEWLGRERWSEEASRLLTLTLNSAIRDYQNDRYFGANLPEILGALSVMAEDPEQMRRQRDWLDGAYRHATQRMRNGHMAPADSLLWSQFADALEKVDAGRATEVDSLSVSWLRAPALAVVPAPDRLPASPPNRYAMAYPSADTTQLETVQAVWERLTTAHERREELTPRQLAALSELIDRLVRENPDLKAFAVRVRELAMEALRSGLPIELEQQWRWLAKNH